jgi:hypothetical protein
MCGRKWLVNRRVKLFVLATLLILVVGVSIYEYYPVYEQQQILGLLRQTRAYDSRFNYELFASVNVSTLPKPSGQWTYKNLVVNYTFNPTSQYPTSGSTCTGCMEITYASGPPCPTDFEIGHNVPWDGFMPPTNCRESLLILITVDTNGNLTFGQYETPGPGTTYGYLPSHVYLFLATYLNYQPPTSEEQQAARFLSQYSWLPYDSFNVRYEQLHDLDVLMLHGNGTLTLGNMTVTYTFEPGSLLTENRPYLQLNYVSGPSCMNPALIQPSDPPLKNCHESLLLVANNNFTSSPMLDWGSRYAYLEPGRSQAFQLYTQDGHYIDWHLYLFLVTYTA